jgi:hypothetical protein
MTAVVPLAWHECGTPTDVSAEVMLAALRLACSSSGNCYLAGQFCSASDNGKSGIAANGQKITCRPSGNRYKWEAS